jgi:hypothetical protein
MIVAVRAAALGGAFAVALGGAFAVALDGAATASAAPNPVITDCNANGHLSRQYSATELRTALATLPADVKEYTDCYDVIQRALLTALGNAGHDGASGAGGGSGGSFLPVPVIVVIVLVALGGVGYGAMATRRRRSPGTGGESEVGRE